MADLANAAAIASILVGMISVPAASGSIGANQTSLDPVENISSTEEVPTDTSTSLGPNSFTKVVETAFSRFSTTIESGQAQGRLQTPQSELRMEKDSGSVTWVLETSKGSIRKERNSTSLVETVRTPRGTLRTVRRNGRISTSFEGSDRSSVEETASELQKLMREKRNKFGQKSEKIDPEENKVSPSLDVKEESPEKVVITNEGTEAVDLGGWRIRNNNPQYFDLESRLKPGQSLHVYSADRNDSALEGISEDGDDLYRYGSDVTWENSGDNATLLDSEGNEVESHSY